MEERRVADSVKVSPFLFLFLFSLFLLFFFFDSSCCCCCFGVVVVGFAHPKPHFPLFQASRKVKTGSTTPSPRCVALEMSSSPSSSPSSSSSSSSSPSSLSPPPSPSSSTSSPGRVQLPELGGWLPPQPDQSSEATGTESSRFQKILLTH